MKSEKENQSGCGCNCSESLLIIYDVEKSEFCYHSDMSVFSADFDSRPLWQIMDEDGFASGRSIMRFKAAFDNCMSFETPKSSFTELSLRDNRGECHHWTASFIAISPKKTIIITLADTGDIVHTDTDELTGLKTRRAFRRKFQPIIHDHAEKVQQGGYAAIYFDIIRFKAVNEAFGNAIGDALLIYIADALKDMLGENGEACRMGADRFMVFVDTAKISPEDVMDKLSAALIRYDLPMEIRYNAGIYVTCKERISLDGILDRAVLAQSAIKGSYNERCKYYTEELMQNLLGEQEIIGMMETALHEKQFVLYYQPQYNHSTGMLVGAEALVRWMHPERGLISPGMFIPIFEKNGFITNLDLYVFEEVCIYLRKCIDSGYTLVPISTNFSRYDIFSHDFVAKLEKIRKKYDVPVKYLRIEITESTLMGGAERTNAILAKLHECGYVVEMDDFGSGYSSLNVLKDIDLDIIKLDMRFLSDDTEGSKGGTIISSVVRMAKWLNLPVIAEGVETVQQANFLRSIGSDYIQGYLYSRPLPEDKYTELISTSCVGSAIPQMKLIDTLNACNFWNPASLETLIFSNYVGGAAIFEYHDGKVEILRVNQKYLSEICMNLTEKELIESDPLAVFDDYNRKLYLDMLDRAIESTDEEECETWRTLSSSSCGDEKVCIRSTVRVIGCGDTSTLFYAMIRNITAEKQQYSSILENERRFKAASEQVNIYYWEYTIATKEMRPCFRCMRDLGLPPLVTNYPEPLFERGIFPMEMHDEYVDWHRRMAEGETGFEAIIPLTADRIPFRVRYTTEFDENGNPVKAYGSAALIVE